MSNEDSQPSAPGAATAEPATPGLLHPGMRERDRQMLQEAAHRLLAHGSILRERSAERALYDWCAEHQGWLEDWGGLLGVKIILQRDERIIMALPEVAALTRRLRREETLVALALWYDYDIELRENGATEVFFSVRDFNERFQNKFPALQAISASRLKEVLRTLSRMNLIEIEWADDLSESAIRVLPTLRFAIPFPDIEEWVKTRDAFLTDEGTAIGPLGPLGPIGPIGPIGPMAPEPPAPQA